ncbi:MAG: hypothetical protein V5A64_01285 [Candidatus Thermoplasmatota archaeon]
MEIMGFTLPLWSILLIGIAIIVLAWKVIKFAVKLLLVFIAVFLGIAGLDAFNVFETLKNLIPFLSKLFF